MTGHIAALYRHPVKGFTPESLAQADLAAGAPFPFDRLYAVENGPSGFDPAAPAFIRKQAFTVLAHMARVAAIRTHYDEATGMLVASAPAAPDFAGDLTEEPGRAAFAAWLTDVLGEDARGPLKVLTGPGGHRFMDHPLGHVSIVNLTSVRDLEARIGRPLDPLRYRANLYVEGWPPWVENTWEGRDLMLGWARARVFKPIVHCAATHVDPVTAQRDIEVVKALFDNYGHKFCGIYVHVVDSGRVSVGDACTLPGEVAP